MKGLFLFSILLLHSICYAQIWTVPQGIREIPIPNLPDIAIASIDPYGPVIYYNPTTCQQVGPLASAFFEAHEYGHHYLGHVINKIYHGDDAYIQAWLTLTAENEADAYAVRYWISSGKKEVIQAGANVMWAINNAGDQSHPPSRTRANNIANYYQQLTGTNLFP